MKSISIRKHRVLHMIGILKQLFPHPQTTLMYHSEWELLVAIILSAQCTDIMVNKVTYTLFKKHKTIHDYAHSNLPELTHEIRQLSFFRTKAKHIKETAKRVEKQYHGQIPKDMDTLLSLPGVGRKTANVFLGICIHKSPGIAVDTHVRRLAQTFHLTQAQNPKQIELDLMKIVPKQYWVSFPQWLIAYGRKYHPARKKDISQTPLGFLCTQT